MDVQTKPRKEECVLDTGQRRVKENAPLITAQILLGKEECVEDMERRLNDAAEMDAQIKLSKEEFASNTGQRGNDAVVMDVQTKLRQEECAIGMG